MNKAKPRLAVISAVLPFPGQSGQQQRVFYKLKALKESFHLTFITVSPPQQVEPTRKKLLSMCDEAIVLPARYGSSFLNKLWHKIIGTIYTWRTGLKFSNYVIGKLELTTERIRPLLQDHRFDLALFEYWHTVDTVAIFHEMDVPCVLDMHNILWQSYARQLHAKPYLPVWLQDRLVAKYKAHEEQAWQQYDVLIAINAAELDYVRNLLPASEIIYTPMGTDLSVWPYCWHPVSPPRVAYYGGLGSPHNQKDALSCFEDIMPSIWQEFPDAELWLVGSNPPEQLLALNQHKQVHVTGFVADVQNILKTMTLVLCPWSGTYGFRSRVIEVMALGVPVIASPDAIYGMDLQDGQGVILAETNKTMGKMALSLLENRPLAKQHSLWARTQIEEKYSFEATYTTMSKSLRIFVSNKSKKSSDLHSINSVLRCSTKGMAT